jgi:glycosyltransferase involved in cell wall biosynthesis/SAM-dependent methyltransferase
MARRTRTMHFVVLTQYFEPEVGAAQSRLSALARGLVAAGHEVTVVTAMPNYPTGKVFPGYRRRVFARERIDGVTVLRVPLYPATGRGRQRLLNYLSFTATAAIGLLVARRPSHVFVESPPLTLALPGVLWARLTRAALVFNVADPWPDVAVELGVMEPGRALDLALRLEAWAYRHATLVTTPTEGVRTRLLESKGVPSDKLVMLPNGADTERFGPDRGDPGTLRRHGLPETGLFIYAGTMGYLHGLANVISAARLAEPHGVHLALVGGGSEVGELKAHAEACGAGNVTFVDPVAPTELAEMLPLAVAGVVSLADIPSNAVVRSAKMFPVMASGRPVLHVGLGEGADLVTAAGAGVVLPNRDPRDIAAAMVDMLTDDEKADAMGEAGRSFVVAELSWDAIVARLLARLDAGRSTMDGRELSEVYGRYNSDEVQSRWSHSNPGNRFILSERLEAAGAALAAVGLTSTPVDILDVGCGTATELPPQVKQRLRIGIDLLPERLVAAGAGSGSGSGSDQDAVACADGAHMPFPDGSFDLVILSTVLSSIASVEVRKAIGAEVDRVLRPGGALLFYDMRLPNPANRSVHPISSRALASYVPNLHGTGQSITLVPQVARRIGDRPGTYRGLARLRALRSHRLAVMVKED